jgi:HEAT repeat protein
MRTVTVAMLAAWLLLLASSPGPAQKKTDKTTEKKAEEPPLLKEIAGKDIDAWIKEIHSKDKSIAENAIRTIVLFHPKLAVKAVPDIISLFKRSGVSAPVDVSLKVNGCIALGDILGPLPAKDRDEKEVADAIIELHKLLKDTQAVVKVRAAQALMCFGPEAKAAIPTLRAALKDTYTPNWELRKVSALALGRIAFETKKGPTFGPHPEVVADLSRTARSDSSFQVRLAALQALGWLGPPRDMANKAQLEATIDLISKKDVEEEVQIWAHMSHMVIKGKIEEPRVDAIGKMLASKHLTVRLKAAQALATVGKDAKSQVPRLIEGISDRDGPVALACILTLGSIGPGAKEAVPSLKKLAASKDSPEALKQVVSGVIDVIEGKIKAKTDGKEEKKGKATAGGR